MSRIANPLPPVIDADAARYTSVTQIHEQLLTQPSATLDARYLQAIIAAESTIDLHMGQALVDRLGQLNPDLEALPAAWSQVALSAAIGILKAAESPYGSAGSDDWLGTISVPQIVGETIRRNPLMLGWKVSFGVR